jgi:hypothetical protein
MSNLAYTRPLGVWNPGIVRAAELADLDAKTVKAPNFADGGTYAPGAPVYVGGEGMQVKLVGISNVDNGGVVRFTSGCSFVLKSGAFLQLDAGSTSSSAGNFFFAAGSLADFSGAFALRSGASFTADAGSSVSLNGNLNLTGHVTASAGAFVSVNGTVALNGGVSFSYNVHFLSGAHVDFAEGTTLALATTLQLTGSGTIQERVVLGTNADGTYSVSNADLVYIPASTLTANRTYFLDENGAVNGKKIRFHREDNQTRNSLTLKRSSDGSTICRLGWANTDYIWTDVVRIAGRWERVAGQFGESAS